MPDQPVPRSVRPGRVAGDDRDPGARAGADALTVRTLVTGAVRTAVVELGDPCGPPAVLLPGLSDGLAPVTDPDTRRMLREIPVPMARFRGLAPSYRDPLEADVSTRDLAADVAAVLRRLVDGPVVLLCHSMGGMVAQHLAVDAPDLVAAMVLSATVARTDDAMRAVLARWDDRLRAGDSGGFARDALVSSFTGEERRRRLASLDGAPPPAPDPERVDRHLRLARACATHDAEDRLHHIEVPTLVLGGAFDVVARPERVRDLADRIDGSRLELHPSAGHAFPEQEPDWFEGAVTGFLQALPEHPGGGRGSHQPARPRSTAENPQEPRPCPR